MQMEVLGAYTLRLFLDSGTTVLAHEWFLEDSPDDGFADDGAIATARTGRGEEGFLHVVVRGRHALVAVSHIAVIEMIPPP
jgi:hypothetical protein